MRKIFILILVITLSIKLFAQSSNDSKFRLGLGIIYASEVESTGLTINGIYNISERWETAIAYSHIFENLNLSWDVLDVDGHYIFYDNDKKLNVYALTGLAFTYWKRETIGTILFPGQTRTGTYIGLNIGVGTNIELSEKFNLVPEIRGTLFDLSYTRIGVTAQFKF
nr:outer membrane beta-barrel protein [uncultured Carboxylicivirga sp.]